MSIQTAGRIDLSFCAGFPGSGLSGWFR